MIPIEKEAVLIKPKDIRPSSKELEVIAAINPGAIRLPNKDILLYVRIIEKLIKDQDEKYYYSPRMIGKDSFEIAVDKFPKALIKEKNPLDFIFNDGAKRLTFISHLRKVILDPSGLKIKSIENKPAFYGLKWDSELGVEDPRIIRIKDLYIMTYVGLSKSENISTYIAISKDCKNWFRRGIIFEEQNKDVVIFPEIIKDRYFAFNRPEGNFEFSPPHIWISSSSDLESWGRSYSLKLLRNKWDSGRLGAGPPPLKTDKGWIFIYHAVQEKEENPKTLIKKLKKFFSNKKVKITYLVGVALLDLENPRKIIAKAKNPIIIPVKKYEKKSLEDKDVVFPTGIVADLNGKDLLIYSGGGDAVTTVKKIALKEIFDSMNN